MLVEYEEALGIGSVRLILFYSMDINRPVAARDIPCSTLMGCWLKGDDILQKMGPPYALIVCCAVELSVFSS